MAGTDGMIAGDWASTRRAAPTDFTLTVGAALARGVDLYGDRLFLIQGDRKLSFRDTERESAALARGFLAMGIGKGTRVGLMLPNTVDWVLNWLALARIGALTMTLSTLFQAREIDWAMRRLDIDTLLVQGDMLGQDFLGRIETALPALATARGAPLYLPEQPYLRRILSWGGNERPWALRAPAAILDAAAAVPQIDDRFLANVEGAVTPADELMAICTSGSTAEPKAVIHTHGAAIRSNWAYIPQLGARGTDRIYSGMPFFWVGGLLRTLFPALFEGATVVCADRTDSQSVLDMIVRDRVTFLNMQAGQLHGVRALAEAGNVDLSFVRAGYHPLADDDGVPIPPEHSVTAQMGMTETFGTHSGEPSHMRAPAGKAGNWGRPQPGIRRRIVDPVTRETLPAGQEGELLVGGPTLMRGYYKIEREALFEPDGMFATGDRCIIDEDDYLWFKGRLSEMIKTAGANVAPREVEAALLQIAGVREPIVFGVPDKARGEAVVAVVVPASGATLDFDAIRQQLRGQISSYKVPQIFIEMAFDDVPRTDTGKPRKPVLKARVTAERDAAAG